jgi:hypothetical protein
MLDDTLGFDPVVYNTAKRWPLVSENNKKLPLLLVGAKCPSVLAEHVTSYDD